MLRIVQDGQEFIDGFAYANLSAFNFPLQAEVDGLPVMLTKETMETLMVEEFTKMFGRAPESVKDAETLFEDRYLTQNRQVHIQQPEVSPNPMPIAPAVEEPQSAVIASCSPNLPTGIEAAYLRNMVNRLGNPHESLRTIALLWLGTPAQNDHVAPRLQALSAFLAEFPVTDLQEQVDANRYTLPAVGVSPAVLYGILMERVINVKSVVELRAVITIMTSLVKE